MAIVYSKLTVQEDGERMVVRRAGRYSSEDVHGTLFEEAPEPKTLEELKEGVGRTGETTPMFGKRPSNQVLEPPPIASNRDAIEVVRVWAAPDDVQQVTLRTNWSDPVAWGLLLVDLARHASLAYEREGRDRAETLARIREGFDAEWSSPTDAPEDLTDEK